MNKMEENSSQFEYVVPVNFSLIPSTLNFKIIKKRDEIEIKKDQIENYLKTDSEVGKIRFNKEHTPPEDVKKPPTTDAYFNSKHNLWWSKGDPIESFFKNLFGVGVPHWISPEKSSYGKKKSYHILPINFSKEDTPTTAGILLEDDNGNSFLAIDRRIGGNYDTHIEALNLHDKKDEIQKFFAENNNSIKIQGIEKPIFLIAKIDETFIEHLSEFVKNIKKVKDYFLYSRPKDSKIGYFDVTNKKFVDISVQKLITTEISTYDLDSEYEKRSNELIIESVSEQEIEQKLNIFESSDTEIKPQKTTTTVLPRNPEIARLKKQQQGHICQICEIPTFKTKNGFYYTESHHIIPVSLNGPDKPSNILIVCANCHRKFDSGNEDTLFETYRILKQKNLISDFDGLKQSNAISENLFKKLNQLNEKSM